MPRPPTVPLAVLAAGAAAVGYGAWERRRPRLRQLQVPVLPPRSRPLRVLHISDTHVTPSDEWLVRWLRGLAALEPDLVVDTGDNLAHPDAVPVMIHALEPLLDRPGVFVGGSNDYFAPRPKNPLRYLLPDTGRRIHGEPLPWHELRDTLTGAGWVNAINRRAPLTVRGVTLDVGGVDDPHIKADRYDRIAAPVDPEADLGLGLVHAPEPRVLDRFARDGFGLLLAGHTHGGQLRIPGYGALVTNCGLDRRRARGLSDWGPDSRLHVSAGLGTSPYAPIRFACPPEATLLTLVAR